MKRIILLIIFNFFSMVYSQTILIDPGHGGIEEGAKVIDKDEVVLEKDLSLKLAKYLQSELVNSGYQVYLTRDEDLDIPLAQRAMMASEVKANLFISLHFNSSEVSEANGFEVYYLSNEGEKASKKLSKTESLNQDSSINQILIDLIIQKTSQYSMKLAKKISYNLSDDLKLLGMKNRGIKPGLFYVLALSKTPSVLIEMGFMTNKSDLDLLKRESFMIQAAKSIAAGIESYF